MIVAKLTVNGKAVTINASPDTPLLWVLRDELKMNGTKFGCGMALCGACTVHINGEPARSCSTPLSACEGKKITTIEGISSKGLHPVQKAWIEFDPCFLHRMQALSGNTLDGGDLLSLAR